MFGERQPYTGFNFKGRLKALGVHLLFSITIFAIFMFVMLKYWYPMPHFEINGGWQGVRIMIAVDLVIGPLLTFFLYNTRKSKKELKFDLGLIIICQLSLLAYGIIEVNSQRPVVQVISHRGYIATPRKEDLVYQYGVKPMPLIKQLNVNKIYPPLVYSVFEDYYKKKQLVENMYSIEKDESLKGDLSPEMIVSRFRALNSLDTLADIGNAQEKAMKVIDTKQAEKQAVEEYIKQYGDNYYFFPLKGEYGEAVVVLDKKTFKQVDYFAIEMFDSLL